MIKKVIEHFGRIDILVNNAGIAGPIKKLHELSTETEHIYCPDGGSQALLPFCQRTGNTNEQ